MPTTRNDVLKESAFETAADWSVSHGKRFRANIIIWGMRKQYSILHRKLGSPEVAGGGSRSRLVPTLGEGAAIVQGLRP